MVHISEWICGSPPARPPQVSSAKAAVTGQHASVVSITGLLANDGKSLVRGIGLLIHPTLVLTTHTTIPSAACLHRAELTFCSDVSSLTYVKRKFVPDIFFQTNIDLDLTVVSCELVAPELTTLVLETSKLRRRAMRKGHTIFIMGCQVREAEEVAILEGKIAAMAGENEYVRFQTGDDLWMPGSAGFDEFGNFAFIVSKPPRLKQDLRASNCASAIAASPFNSSSASSSTSGRASSTGLFWRRPKQWGTTVYAAKDWLEPLWKTKRNELFRGQVQKPPRRTSAAMMETVNKQKSFTPRSSSPVDSLASSSAVLADPGSSAVADSKENERKQPANIARIQASSAAELEPPASKDYQKPTANAKKGEADHEDDEEDEPQEEEDDKNDKRKTAGATTGRKAQAKAGTNQVKTKPRQQKAADKKKSAGGGRKVKKKRRPAAEETAVQTEILIEEARVAPVVAVCRRPAETTEEGIQTDAVLEYVDAMLLATSAAGSRRRERWELPERGAAADDGAGATPKPIRSTSLKDEGTGSTAAWVNAYYSHGRPNSGRTSRSSSAATTPPPSIRRPVSSLSPSASSSSSEHNSSVSPDPPVRPPLRSSTSPSSASAKARNSSAAAAAGGSTSSNSSSSSVYSRPAISYMQKRSHGPARHPSSRSSTSQPRWT